jgi:hypothetical protein
MKRPSFDAVWARIRAHEGERFRQIRGQEFTYVVAGSALVPSTTKQNLARSQFEQAYALVPLPDTTSIQHLRGPSYLYAVLMDARVRQADW